MRSQMWSGSAVRTRSRRAVIAAHLASALPAGPEYVRCRCRPTADRRCFVPTMAAKSLPIMNGRQALGVGRWRV